MPTEYHDHTVLKLGDDGEQVKFFVCPAHAITGTTWDLIRQVNLCCDGDGNVRHLPEPQYSILDQPPPFLYAVEIMRRERNSDWYNDLIEQRVKEKAHG